jgi:integrase
VFIVDIEAIRNAIPGEVIWDDPSRVGVKGLHLRVSLSGKKSFLLYYRTRDGKQRRPKIGDFGELTLAEARKRARKLIDRVAAGEDPSGDWQEAKRETSVRELYARVEKELWSKERFVRSGYLADVRVLWRRHIDPALGSLKLSDLDPVRVRVWHQAMENKPYAANRALSVLSRMMSFAEQHGIRPVGSNPCRMVEGFKERKRKRFASLEEIKRIGEILIEESKTSPGPAAFLYLLLTTGSRPSAIERAGWEDLACHGEGEGRFAILTLRGKSTEKTGEDETVVIAPQALAIIDRLPRVQGGTITGCKMPRALWRKIQKEVGCGDLWARDLRRTFATVGMSHGTNMGMISELLNHKSTQTTKRYAKLMDTKRVEAALEIAAKVESMFK